MEGINTDSDCFFDEASRSCRNKKHCEPVYCPICSITVRSSEIDSHLTAEIDKLYKISNTKHRANGRTNSPSSSAVNGCGLGTEWDTYKKIRSNRHRRQRLKTCKRSAEEVVCPICCKEITEEINAHVEKCLRKSNTDTEDDIDVESSFDEYVWAGQSRVRIISLLPGGVTDLGTRLRTTDEDDELVVDDDDNAYGSPQYSEHDIILCGNDTERDALRKAVFGSSKDSTLNNDESASKTDSNDDHNGDPILVALKNRIHELESYCLKDTYKCLICMECYKTPVISTCCWHVYCEQCWLQTLGAKKLCPQCNMITSPTNLRRIYM